MFRNPTVDLLVVLLIVLLIFGPKRLPTLGRQLGHGLREFKESITGESKGEGDTERSGLPPAPTVSEPAVGATAGAAPQPEPAQQRPVEAPARRESPELGSEQRS